MICRITKVFQLAESVGKKQFINEGLVIPGHEVLDYQKLFLLPIQPKRSFMILALWVAAIPAGTGVPWVIWKMR